MADNADREIRLSLVTFLSRFSVGVVMLFYGVGKFVMGFSNFVGWITGTFKDAWLPSIFWMPFTYTIPFAEIVLGIVLIIGLKTRWSLFLTGLYLVGLTFGQVVLSKPEVVAHNLIFVILIAVGIWTSESDRFSLDALLKGGERDKVVK